ncbi:MAG TPA: BON domain-containing protein [Candidatus Limnocylindrales bacterium]|jgi:osmotically-inducible protein OsmY|nr:BON domain-containing protein [Candidatus Limnocylindrales bacterium]
MSAHSQPETTISGKQHTSWQKRPISHRLDDRQLAAAATEAIEILTTVPQESIRVTARNGWLWLEGTVNWRHERTIVEDVTKHLPGVRGVSDLITINASLQ